MTLEARLAKIDKALNEVKYEIWPMLATGDEFGELVDSIITELIELRIDYSIEY